MKSGRNHRVREERMIRLSSLPLRRHSWIWWELPLACNVCICVFVFLVKLILGVASTSQQCVMNIQRFSHANCFNCVICIAREHMSVCLCVCVCVPVIWTDALSQVARLSSISLPFRVNLLFNGGLISSIKRLSRFTDEGVYQKQISKGGGYNFIRMVIVVSLSEQNISSSQIWL